MPHPIFMLRAVLVLFLVLNVAYVCGRSIDEIKHPGLRAAINRRHLIARLRNVVRRQYDRVPAYDLFEEPLESSGRRLARLNGHISKFLFDGDMLISPNLLRNIVVESERELVEETKSKREDSRETDTSDEQTLGEGSGQEEEEKRHPRTKRQAYRDELYPTTIWRQGVPYSISKNFSQDYVDSIMKAVYFWGNETCIDFREKTAKDGKHYLFFDNQEEGCWSTVGLDEFEQPQVVNIGNGCFLFGITSHELAHALGLFHHQQRYDRDNNILFHANNVPQDLLMQFSKIPRKYLSTYKLPYDVGSVMHYTPTEFSFNGRAKVLIAKNKWLQNTMGSMDMPSFLDVLLINKHYNCTARCKNPPKCINGGYVNPRNCTMCKCPTGYSGPTCNQVEPSVPNSCGGLLTAASKIQKIEISIDGRRSMERLQCVYHIRSPALTRVKIGLGNVRGFCVEGCYMSGLEIKGTQDARPVGYRFCCKKHSKQIIYADSRNVPITFFALAGITNATVYYHWVPKYGISAGDDYLINKSLNETSKDVHAEIFAQRSPQVNMRLSFVPTTSPPETEKTVRIISKSKAILASQKNPLKLTSSRNKNPIISHDEGFASEEILDLSLLGTNGKSDVDFANED